ncbi:MAG: GNAT family N-acetyltransferase [Anaerobacillus sp.]|uniref:GNAT family N-acetyltransferase n=1 Tax=Anaerobacillus sp. TaxID=1872506 RepID=UPI0039188FF5
MEVRVLEPTDAKDYQLLRLEALQTNPEAFVASYEEEKDYPLEHYENRFCSEYSVFFGAFDNGQLVGVVSLVKETKQKLKHRANIFAMYITPSARGLGIGRKLMIAAIENALNSEGIEQVYLSVVTTNKAGRNLYLNLGFEIYGRDYRAIKIGNRYFDEDHMVLFL